MPVEGPAPSGSSPRARGTRLSPRCAASPFRFIPAGAGNTFAEGVPTNFAPVHPRGRGEHDRRSQNSPPAIGSSPRARGTRRDCHCRCWWRRFIPAGAGNTRWRMSSATGNPVHPRGRGEHKSAVRRGKVAGGSSPRARGTRPTDSGTRQTRWFIPAGARNTVGDGAAANATTVHPRGRGEHRWAMRRKRRRFGSSPRARGTRGRT